MLKVNFGVMQIMYPEVLFFSIMLRVVSIVNWVEMCLSYTCLYDLSNPLLRVHFECLSREKHEKRWRANAILCTVKFQK